MNDEQSQWIADIYRQMYDLMLRYAGKVLQNTPQAEEAIQETFRIACDKPQQLMASPNPQGWIMNTLKGVIQNQLRKNRKQSDLFIPIQDTGLPCSVTLDQMPLEVLYGDMADCQEFQLLMAVSEGETVKEIAQRMGISEDSCKKRVQRSRRYLKSKIKKEE